MLVMSALPMSAVVDWEWARATATGGNGNAMTAALQLLKHAAPSAASTYVFKHAQWQVSLDDCVGVCAAPRDGRRGAWPRWPRANATRTLAADTEQWLTIVYLSPTNALEVRQFQLLDCDQEMLGKLVRHTRQRIRRDALSAPAITVLLNPIGGRRQARGIYKKYVQPILEMNACQVRCVETEYAGHAYDYGKSLGTTAGTLPDCLACVSGDGLLHEFMNGLLASPTGRTVLDRMRVAVIPAGTGNAIATSINVTHPARATLAIVHGRYISMDLLAMRHLTPTPSPVRYGLLELLWTLLGDIDIESEKLRVLGSARFSLWAVWRLLRLRRYHGRLWYLPEGVVPKAEELVGVVDWQSEKQVQDVLPASAGWVKVDGPFTYFTAMNAPWVSHDTLATPYADLSSGKVELVWMHRPRRWEVLKMLLEGQTARWIDGEGVEKRSVKAFVLVPGGVVGKRTTAPAVDHQAIPSDDRIITRYPSKRIMDLDGESVSYTPLMVNVEEAVVKLVVPQNYRAGMWKPQ